MIATIITIIMEFDSAGSMVPSSCWFGLALDGAGVEDSGAPNAGDGCGITPDVVVGKCPGVDDGAAERFGVVGHEFGPVDGDGIGVAVGDRSGSIVGMGNGILVGTGIGMSVGVGIGIAVGKGEVGLGLGARLGEDVGISLGGDVGIGLGEGVGENVPIAIASNDTDDNAELFIAAAIAAIDEARAPEE